MEGEITMRAVAEVLKTVAGFGAIILFGIGGLYWLFEAIQLGSFFMFILGIAGPLFLITSPIGAYAFVFGWPDWIHSLFG